METGAWKTPVVIEMYGRPGMVFITGTLDAALMLIGAWPTKRTEMHMAAVLSCRNVLAGTAEPALARATFIEAAIEAGYRIEPETFLSDRWDLTTTSGESREPALGLAALIRKRSQSKDDIPAEKTVPSDADTKPVPSAAVRPAKVQDYPGLGELTGKLVLILGQISLQILWSLTGLFTIGLVRRTGRQAH